MQRRFFSAARKAGFSARRLDAGVNHPVADTGIFRPGRNQPPQHLLHVPLAVVTNHNHRLRWRDVVPGRCACRPFVAGHRRTKAVSHLFQTNGQGVAPTHAALTIPPQKFDGNDFDFAPIHTFCSRTFSLERFGERNYLLKSSTRPLAWSPRYRSNPNHFFG